MYANGPYSLPHVASLNTSYLPSNALISPHRGKSFQLRVMLGAGGTLIAASAVGLAVYLNTDRDGTPE